MKEVDTMYTIAITGHRPHKLPCGYNFLPEQSLWSSDLINFLVDYIMKAYHEHGTLRILSGMALGVDQLWCLAAVQAKKRGADLKLVACIPCIGYDQKWPYYSQKTYANILSKCDEQVHVTSAWYTPACLQLRNEYMVDHTDELIAVWNSSPSGTANCVNYAKRKNVPVTIIPPSKFLRTE